MNEPISEIWVRLESFLGHNTPGLLAGLAPGATGDEISEVERICGFQFPLDVRQSYLRHDGQLGDFGEPQGGTFIPGCFGLLSISKILYKWQGNVETIEDLEDDMPDGNLAGPGVKAVFLDPAWVPFAKDIGGNLLCLDFDPAVGGSMGQIVEFNHEAEGQQCIAADFKAWLNRIVRDLESGLLLWDEKYECYDYPN